jgi:hypothetical protein
VLKSQSGLDKRKNDGEDGEGGKGISKDFFIENVRRLLLLSAFSVLSDPLNLTPSLSSG